MSILDGINSPRDLKKLTLQELRELAGEVRNRIIDVTSRNGGHVAPNLGAVELTIALHYVFNAPRDKIIWDVGHQCYTHKLLTGRRDRFHTIRRYGGISGFPKRNESEYDVFDTGHAGTSLSAGFGLATARDLKKEKYHVVSVIGDGSAITGMALEAFNHIGDSQTNLMVVLNDNAMSIGRSTGAISAYLSRITARLTASSFYQRLRVKGWILLGKLFRTSGDLWRGWARRLERGIKGILTPGGFFEDMGFHYFGPVDGHDLKELSFYLTKLKDVPGPVLLHVVTEKGHGFKGATDNPELFHGIGPYDPLSCMAKESSAQSYSNFFGRTLTDFASEDQKVVAITAGMTLGTGLVPFRETYPDRFFDFGISEEHCTTFAAGLALRGMKPVFAVYSTFLQRALDQVIHDVALQKLPVVFAIDRGGLVGADGSTHHGVFDLSYLRMIPNMVIAAPSDEAELRDLLYTAINYTEGPFAIRFPRDSIAGVEVSPQPRTIKIGSWNLVNSGTKVAVLACGKGVSIALDSLKLLRNVHPTVINARFVKPLDDKLLSRIFRTHKALVTVEDNVLAGGFGSAVLEWLEENGCSNIRVERIGLPDRFIEHGPQKRLLADNGVSPQAVAKAVKGLW